MTLRTALTSVVVSTFLWTSPAPAADVHLSTGPRAYTLGETDRAERTGFLEKLELFVGVMVAFFWRTGTVHIDSGSGSADIHER